MSVITDENGTTIIVFQSQDWYIEDNPEEFKYTVNIFGQTKENEQVNVTIHDFANYVYIQLPLKTIGGKSIQWSSDKCDRLVEFIYEDWRVKSEDFPFFKLVWRKPLYFYHENDDPFLMVGCSCRQSIYKLSNIFGEMKKITQTSRDDKGKIKKKNTTITQPKKIYIPDIGEAYYEICAGRVEPSIKFITAKESRYSGWYKVTGKLVSEKKKRSMCKYEINVRMKDIQLVDINEISKPKIASFDTEFYSHNHNKMPDIQNPIDECYLIGVSVKRLCEKIETIEKYAICTKQCNQEKMDDINIIDAEDERDLLIKFKDLLLNINPDVITGYNIFNFDFERLCWRAKNIWGIWDEFGQLSKFWNMECAVSGKGWESDAYGAMNFYYPITPGRVHLDVHTFISREIKLIKYKLDYVAKKFLNMRKIDISAKQQFEMFENGDPNKISDLIKYCIQDTVLPLMLIEKLNVWVGLVEMSNVANASVLTLQVRGQQIKTFASLYKKADQCGFVINNPPSPAFDHFQGATVINPISGIYHYIPSHDFASLYPSIMIAFNICYTTLLIDGVHDHIPDSQCNVLEWEDHIGCEHAEKRKTKINADRVVCGKKFRYRFIKKEIFEGLIPRILNELLSSRKATRAELKKYTDDTGKPSRDEYKLICNILDKRQNSYKITCNSTYGFLGVGQNGMLPLMEGAAGVTAMGRKLIGIAIQYVHSNYPKSKLIYGDTDSCFHDFQSKSSKECFEIGRKISTEVSAKFPQPVKLEFEKVLKVLLIFTKKRYAGIICDEDDHEKGLFFKGIAVAKRNGAPYLRKVYKQVLDKVLHNSPKDEVTYLLCDNILKMFTRQIPVEKLTMIVKVGKSKDDRLAQVHLVNMEHDRGVPVQQGERLEYIFVQTDIKGNQKFHVESLRYFKENIGEKKLDYIYYFERQFLKPLAEIMKVVYGDNKFMKHLYEAHCQKLEVVETIKRIAKKMKMILMNRKEKIVEKNGKKMTKKIKEKVIPIVRNSGCIYWTDKDGELKTEFVKLK